MPDSGRERYRRAALRLPDHRGGGRRTGHAAMFRLDQVVELGDFPDGGGFPSRFLADVAYPTLGVTDPARVLHICSGSVRAPFTVDRRSSVRPAVVADARSLPFPDDSFEWAIADPPYSREWARTLYGISARQYPTPGGIVREAMRVLRPGGRLGLLHYMVPPFGPGERLLGVWGITIGPGSTIRAWSVLEKLAAGLPLLLGDVRGRVRDPVPQLGRNEFDFAFDGVTELPYRGTPADVSSRLCACGCGHPVELGPTGRPRLYVGPAHRQRAYRHRLIDDRGELAPPRAEGRGRRS